MEDKYFAEISPIAQCEKNFSAVFEEFSSLKKIIDVFVPWKTFLTQNPFLLNKIIKTNLNYVRAFCA